MASSTVSYKKDGDVVMIEISFPFGSFPQKGTFKQREEVCCRLCQRVGIIGGHGLNGLNIWTGMHSTCNAEFRKVSPSTPMGEKVIIEICEPRAVFCGTRIKRRCDICEKRGYSGNTFDQKGKSVCPETRMHPHCVLLLEEYIKQEQAYYEEVGKKPYNCRHCKGEIKSLNRLDHTRCKTNSQCMACKWNDELTDFPDPDLTERESLGFKSE